MVIAKVVGVVENLGRELHRSSEGHTGREVAPVIARPKGAARPPQRRSSLPNLLSPEALEDLSSEDRGFATRPRVPLLAWSESSPSAPPPVVDAMLNEIEIADDLAHLWIGVDANKVTAGISGIDKAVGKDRNCPALATKGMDLSSRVEALCRNRCLHQLTSFTKGQYSTGSNHE